MTIKHGTVPIIAGMQRGAKFFVRKHAAKQKDFENPDFRKETKKRSELQVDWMVSMPRTTSFGGKLRGDLEIISNSLSC
jgi:hypothetical protein